MSSALSEPGGAGLGTLGLSANKAREMAETRRLHPLPQARRRPQRQRVLRGPPVATCASRRRARRPRGDDRRTATCRRDARTGRGTWQACVPGLALLRFLKRSCTVTRPVRGAVRLVDLEHHQRCRLNDPFGLASIFSNAATMAGRPLNSVPSGFHVASSAHVLVQRRDVAAIDASRSSC